MNTGKTLFAQIMDFLPWKRFHRINERRHGDPYVRYFSAAEQFRVMAFAQLAYRESLRDIEICLAAQSAKLYHMGLSQPVKRATLADANERRDWRLFAEAVKLHTLLDLRGNIPKLHSPLHREDGRCVGGGGLDKLCFEPGATYIMDRGYLDFARLYRLHEAKAFLVTRPKHNTLIRTSSSIPLSPNQRVLNCAAAIRSDQRIRLTGKHTREHYPQTLRRIHLVVPETGKTRVLLTNHFALPATTIAALYKARWQVELFSKWIKQHLRIEKFHGHSENAVKTQIWIAVSVYVLIAIIKKRLKLERSLYGLLQVLSLTLFEKTTLQEALQGATVAENEYASANQLNLF